MRVSISVGEGHLSHCLLLLRFLLTALVAATGIPEYRRDHAIAMVRFAKDCINSMKGSVRVLEKTLGPGTGNLGIRVGLHSGPVSFRILVSQSALRSSTRYVLNVSLSFRCLAHF